MIKSFCTVIACVKRPFLLFTRTVNFLILYLLAPRLVKFEMHWPIHITERKKSTNERCIRVTLASMPEEFSTVTRPAKINIHIINTPVICCRRWKLPFRVPNPHNVEKTGDKNEAPRDASFWTFRRWFCRFFHIIIPSADEKSR